MSWKPEVIADASGKWVTNALRFATCEEARANVEALAYRWLAVREWRASECNDPVTHVWRDGGLIELSEDERNGANEFVEGARANLPK